MANVTPTRLLTVRDLRLVTTAPLHAAPVNGANFFVDEGECLGIVGESGSGKSLSMRAIAGLLPRCAFKQEASELSLFGTDLLSKTGETGIIDARRRLAMIFQDPSSHLNPLMSIGMQVAESAQLGRGVRRREALDLARKALEDVGVPDVKDRMSQYPDSLSGGLKQRVMIAAALVAHPRLIIADEPTTALDVTTQLQSLRLLRDLTQKFGISVILVTHDLGVISQASDRVSVFYAGQDVETGTTASVLRKPEHPYTKALMRAHPSSAEGQLDPIPGVIDRRAAMSPLCRFLPRCLGKGGVCEESLPPAHDGPDGRSSRCHFSFQGAV